MYVYNYRLFDRYGHQVASFAVLSDPNPDWRPDQFGYDLWGCEVKLRFPIVKLLDYASAWEALEANPNPCAVVTMAHLKTQEARRSHRRRLEWKLRLVKGLYERGYSREDVLELFRFSEPNTNETVSRKISYQREKEGLDAPIFMDNGLTSEGLDAILYLVIGER